jgi:hypothetical protein
MGILDAGALLAAPLVARHTACFGNYIPSHVSVPHKKAAPKRLTIPSFFFNYIDTCGIPLTQLSSMWKFRSFSVRNVQACPEFPTILQGLTRKLLPPARDDRPYRKLDLRDPD